MAKGDKRLPPELIAQARAVNVVTLVEGQTPLRRVSALEYAGPCPRCGGDDRFHCTPEWWFCRQCHSQRGDAIELLRWLTPGLGFVDAVRRLVGPLADHTPPLRAISSPTPLAIPPAAPQPRPPQWQARALALVEAAQERLYSPDGVAGVEYLLARGLEPRVWLTYRLGLRADVPVPGSQGAIRLPALVLPWYDATQQLVAVRYRFLPSTAGPKLTAEVGSSFSGRLFGGQALPAWALRSGEAEQFSRHTLVLVEGEINAMSVWAVAGETRLHVLSIGSEHAKLSPGMVALARRYGRVLVWADQARAAQALMAALPGAVGIQSPAEEDANDLHRRERLGGFLAYMRARHARSPGELSLLLENLTAAAQSLDGVDAAVAAVMRSLAAQLNVGLPLVEISRGRWGVESAGGGFVSP